MTEENGVAVTVGLLGNGNGEQNAFLVNKVTSNDKCTNIFLPCKNVYDFTF